MSAVHVPAYASNCFSNYDKGSAKSGPFIVIYNTEKLRNDNLSVRTSRHRWQCLVVIFCANRNVAHAKRSLRRNSEKWHERGRVYVLTLEVLIRHSQHQDTLNKRYYCPEPARDACQKNRHDATTGLTDDEILYSKATDKESQNTPKYYFYYL